MKQVEKERSYRRKSRYISTERQEPIWATEYRERVRAKGMDRGRQEDSETTEEMRQLTKRETKQARRSNTRGGRNMRRNGRPKRKKSMWQNFNNYLLERKAVRLRNEPSKRRLSKLIYH